uniref:Uncharacterized protein n=1 Tax=Arundo donax TaxID=35708 RepID=A0A0A9AI81_ARUDO
MLVKTIGDMAYVCAGCQGERRIWFCRLIW